MRSASGPRRCHDELARVSIWRKSINSLTVFAGEEFGTNMKNGNFDTSRDRRQILRRTIAQRAIKRPVRRQRRGSVEDRVAVRIGMGDELVADIGAGAAFVVDDDLLTPNLRKLMGDDARIGVGRSARGDRHDHVHRADPATCFPPARESGRDRTAGANTDVAESASKRRRVSMAQPPDWIAPSLAVKRRRCHAPGCVMLTAGEDSECRARPQRTAVRHATG